MKLSFSFLPLILLVLLLLTVCRPAAAQAPVWQSAQAVAAATAANTYSTVTATTVDVAGNVYLAGYFANKVVLGSTTLTSLGANDVFVAKFNPASNQFIWARQAGGSGDDLATALAVSGSSVYVTGYFTGAAASFGATTLTTAGSSDVFVAKLMDGGSFAWAQQAGGAWADYATTLAADGTSVYVAGNFGSPTASFGATTLTNTGAFVAKLMDGGSTGSFVWAQRAGNTGYEYAYALAVSGANVYIAGYFTSPTTSFGPITLTNAASANPGTHDLFVAKLTDEGSAGSFVWAQRAGGTADDDAYALAVSGTSVYVAGHFGSPTTSFGATALTTAGTTDVFVAKLTDAGPTGSFVWAQRAGGGGDDNAWALAVSGTNVYVAGDFDSPTADFGTSTLTEAGHGDVFVAKLTDTGNTGSFAWAQRAGGTRSEEAYALAVSGTSVYVAGGFNSPIADFGATMLTNGYATGNSSSDSDVFVAKLTDGGNTGSFAWAQRAGGASLDVAGALAVSGTGVVVAGTFTSLTSTFGPFALTNPNGNSFLSFVANLPDPTLTATTTGRTLTPAQLYPNPARHTASLLLPAGTAPAPLTLSDALGRTVRRYPAPATPETTLDLRGLPAGLYLLRGAGPALRLQVE